MGMRLALTPIFLVRQEFIAHGEKEETLWGSARGWDKLVSWSRGDYVMRRNPHGRQHIAPRGMYGVLAMQV